MSSAGSHRRRMLDQADIERALSEVAALAAQEGVSVALAGGIALQHYGSDRFTADLDVVASGAIRGLPSQNALSFGGYGSTTPSGVPVDVILRDDDERRIYAEALEYARRVPELPMRVISPEYAFVMKMMAGRPKDVADLDTLLALEVVDLDKLRRLVKRLLGLYAVRELENLLRESAWRREKAGR